MRCTGERPDVRIGTCNSPGGSPGAAVPRRRSGPIGGHGGHRGQVPGLVLLGQKAGPEAVLGPHYYASRSNPERKVRQHVRDLQALGYTVTLNLAA